MSPVKKQKPNANFDILKLVQCILRTAELGETIPNSISTNGNNTWLLTVLMKNGIEIF